MKQAIIILIKTTDEPCYFGPFPSGEAATQWGAVNCRGFNWYWEEIAPVNQPEPIETIPYVEYTSQA